MIEFPFNRVSPGKAKGLTLIEVLITLLVLSIGLLGLAALQLTAVQNVHSALQVSVASTAALDFEERAWLALAGLDSGCVEIDQAFLDKFQDDWSAQQGALGLPGLKVEIDSQDIVNPRWQDHILTISWSEGRFSGNSGEESFTFAARTKCIPGDE